MSFTDFFLNAGRLLLVKWQAKSTPQNPLCAFPSNTLFLILRGVEVIFFLIFPDVYS